MLKFIHDFPALYAAVISLSALIIVFVSEKLFCLIRTTKRKAKKKKQNLKIAAKAGIKKPGSMDKATLINMVSRYNKECRRKKKLLPNEPRSDANQVNSWERKMKK